MDEYGCLTGATNNSAWREPMTVERLKASAKIIGLPDGHLFHNVTWSMNKTLCDTFTGAEPSKESPDFAGIRIVENDAVPDDRIVVVGPPTEPGGSPHVGLIIIERTKATP